MSLELEIHPAAELFPAMDGKEFDELVADIKKNGLLEPITVHKGKIIDGRNRYRACIVAGVDFIQQQWDGDAGESIVEWVLSKNLHRRHLDATQRAMIAARSLEQFTQEAAERMKAGTKASQEAKGKATAKAAAATGASRPSVERAKAIIDKGDKKLIAAVDMGTVSVKDGAKIVDKPKAEQRAAVKAVEEGKAKTVAAAVEGKPRGGINFNPEEWGGKPAKNGAPLFDDRKITDTLKKMVDLIEARAKVYRHKGTAPYKACYDSLDAFAGNWEKWQKVRS